MPTCNINQAGQVIRFLLGFVMFVTGLLLFIIAVPGGGLWWRLLQSGMMVGGIFLLYEGAMGWCALRAMGFKTRF